MPIPIFPPRLQSGDEVRIISPSRSLAVVAPELQQLAQERLAALGLRCSFGAHTGENDRFHSASVESRLADLHAAFATPSVKAILTTLGGYNANQLLDGLDYDLIAANPKILCGYSDITALHAAIYAHTGLVTYNGPHYSSLGMLHGLEYSLAYFRQCLMQSEPFAIAPAEQWSDDAWYREQQKRRFLSNPGWRVLQTGQAQGRLIGGNLCTLNLLQGTAHMPPLDDCILFVEDDEESQAVHFDRDLLSLLQQSRLHGLRALLVGRFQNASRISDDDLAAILGSKPQLAGVPIVTGLDFGHTTPLLTLPFGGLAHLDASGSSAQLTILEH